METVENTYPDLPAAISGKAVEEGWIPAFLPPSSTAIKERHNLDTGEVWIRFSADLAELNSMIACRQIDSADVVHPRKAVGGWWPEELTGTAEGRKDTGHVYYRCSNGGWIAADQVRQETFYWYHRY